MKWVRDLIYAVMWHPEHRKKFRKIFYFTFVILFFGMSFARVNVSFNEPYTSVHDVAAYIYTYDRLPNNYVIKQSFDLIDGDNVYFYDVFNNEEGLLPEDGYIEAYINATKTDLGKERLVFSDTLVYYTDDHYASFDVISWFSIFGLHLIIRSLFWIVNFSIISIIYYSIRKQLISWTILIEDIFGDIKQLKNWIKRFYYRIFKP
jgi:hypothetical protein